MTLKEFVEKYHVPYCTVYNATYNVKSYSTWMHNREYPEHELRDESVRQTEAKIRRYRKLMNQQIEILANLRENK